MTDQDYWILDRPSVRRGAGGGGLKHLNAAVDSYTADVRQSDRSISVPPWMIQLIHPRRAALRQAIKRSAGRVGVGDDTSRRAWWYFQIVTFDIIDVLRYRQTSNTCASRLAVLRCDDVATSVAPRS